MHLYPADANRQVFYTLGLRTDRTFTLDLMVSGAPVAGVNRSLDGKDPVSMDTLVAWFGQSIEYSLPPLPQNGQAARSGHWAVVLNRIYYGPPGTGKTYRLQTLLRDYTEEDAADNRYRFVTFHPSYAYEDFIEGIRPAPHGGAISYVVTSGVFKHLCDMARDRPDEEFLIDIDEINRGTDQPDRTGQARGHAQWPECNATLFTAGILGSRQCQHCRCHEHGRPLAYHAGHGVAPPF